MNFKNWLVTEEQSGSGILLAKAVSKEGLDSISKNGFQLQQSHQSAQNTFDKYKDDTAEQNYGPGLYFSFAISAERAKNDCAKYKEFGSHVVLATIPNPCKILITHWFPENHPIWKLSPAGYAGIYDQFVKLGINDQFPDYTKNDTHVDKNWGYKFSKLIDAWVHDHNMIPHIVVYNPSILKYLDGFECVDQNKNNQNFASTTKQLPNTNPATGKPFDKNIPLSKQTRLGSLDNLLQRVQQIQQNPNHPEYAYWKGYQIFEKPKPKPNDRLMDL